MPFGSTPLREQHFDDLRVALAGGVGHRVLLETIDGVDIGTTGQERRDHLHLTRVGCRHQGRDTVQGRQIDVRAGLEHGIGHAEFVLLERNQQRRLAEPVARVGGGALLQFTREGRGIRVAGGEQQPRVDAQVLLAGEGRRGDAEQCRRRQGKRRHQDVPERHVRSPH